MTTLVHIALYSDVHCPYAYLTAYRLRALHKEYQGKVLIEYKSLALEYVNRRGTPKVILDNETPILLLEEPDIPYQPWNRSLTEWPVTMWPAFEAIKCAEKQSPELGAELDWAIRVAFFAECQCISLRHVLLALAEKVGLDMQQFSQDFDSGVMKHFVLEDAQRGWEQLKVSGSPTFVLPNGKQLPSLGLPKARLDPAQNYRLVEFIPAPSRGQANLDLYRAMFAEALQSSE